ncbi:5'-3' exonuclease [Cerasicoccus fimbriatus]|uniref:5'-3' exonuclease n=1 Tax=Cerasicoccus fimbriatus TaxID=3014554 RepID=UPI0022B41C4B|nr:5'-3' exonuclease H3TH domain-containing protein [Cerasicoccus sp. TK19100]
MSKILLVDGYNITFRSYYALPDLTRSDGLPTGALHGWIKAMWKLEDLEQPDIIAVFFDEGGSDRHLAILPDYKANRDETPEALEQQVPLIRELTSLLGYPVRSQRGIEADDLIGSAARILGEQGHEVVIVSADKDLAQCVGGNVTQLLPAPTANPRIGWRKLDAEGVTEKFGVAPELVVDYLALIGDTSDNIPGLKGCGPKTAAKWLNEFGSLENTIANAADIKPPRFREQLPAFADDLRRNVKLVTLDTSFDCGQIERAPVEMRKLVDFLELMEMKQSADQAYERYGLGLG